MLIHGKTPTRRRFRPKKVCVSPIKMLTQLFSQNVVFYMRAGMLELCWDPVKVVKCIFDPFWDTTDHFYFCYCPILGCYDE